MSLVSDLEGLSLSLDDCRCPVCLEIFMEPVTLPCSHTFCKVCFLESVDKATLCCPLCRKRISSWARLHSRKNSMVDQKLWSRIQSSFPLQCERRIRGEEEEPGVFFPRVCLPGELKQEYEDQVSRLTEERLLLKEEESRQSEELIRRLLQEEQLELQEERTRREEEDGRLALLLSSQLNAAPAVVSAAKKKKKTEVSGGQMERFLCHLPAHSSSSEGCFMSNKENILLRDEALQEERLEGFLCPSEEEQRESRFHADAGPSSSKRKISERSEDEDLTAPKRGCPSPFSPTVDLTGWESRQQQEEDDRRLALVLQKELDQEERQRASDRRKGSAEPYLLRQNRGSTKTSSTNTSSTKTSSRGSTRTSSCPETSSRGGPETSSRG
ncbi:E3 ubiquitin-protein ligase rnf168, partial [Gymnodraco acuticeps]|uniref:RING-type E3 ubiquitin transferase n=1 Tax=Gymnodraco acuticeps TaxID=8218 RepID=A0A6P8SXZ8_GYMAC